MVDTERVLRLLDGIRRDVEALRRLGARSTDPVALDAIKYRFITAIEGTARIAHHMCVSEGWTAPDSNSAALAELAARAVIPETLGTNLSRAVGFRNLLVHQYAAIDNSRVVSMLAELDDLDAFVDAVGRWLETDDPPA